MKVFYNSKWVCKTNRRWLMSAVITVHLEHIRIKMRCNNKWISRCKIWKEKRRNLNLDTVRFYKISSRRYRTWTKVVKEELWMELIPKHYYKEIWNTMKWSKKECFKRSWDWQHSLRILRKNHKNIRKCGMMLRIKWRRVISSRDTIKKWWWCTFTKVVKCNRIRYQD